MSDQIQNNFVVRNIMEELVDSKVDEFMEGTEMCRCPQCRADVLALALNKLPPKYIATTSGDVFTRVAASTTQFQADIIAAIVQAVDLVSKNPRHPKGSPGNTAP